MEPNEPPTPSSPSKLIWRDWLHRPTWAWQAYWFRPTPLLRLALLRIIFVSMQLLFFLPSLAFQQMLIERNDTFVDPQVIISLLANLVSEPAFRSMGMMTAIWSVTLIAGLLALVGLFTRSAMFLFALGNAIMVAHGFSYGTQHHPEALFTIALFLLAFAPAGEVLSVDAWRKAKPSPHTSTPISQPSLRSQSSPFAFWPLLTIQWLIALVYLNAGFCKIYMSDMTWFTPTAMQAWLLEDAVRWNRPLGLWVAQQPTLALLMALFAVVFETTFFVALLYRRLVPLYVIAGLSMHLGIFILQAAPFWQFMLLYLAFVPLERIWNWLARLAHREPLPAPG